MSKLRIIFSWVFAIWTSKVFLTSLYYKFDPNALEPQHIFSTIGAWMSETLGTTIGQLFADFGQYVIGGAELVTSIILLAPIVLWKHQRTLHQLGALLSVGVMAGAIFFHVFTPLGWKPTWAVANQDECFGLYDATNNMCIDPNLANAALSIFVLGIIVAIINRKPKKI